MPDVRVRFAPSPTGTLHIGSARTALFNWLLARHHQGTFILRVEDTDRKRSKPAFLKDILESLKWMGLQWDEGPYFQSKRLALYQKHARRLLASGRAYKAGRSKAIMFKFDPVKVQFHDLVHGELEFDNTLLQDLVIVKSDGLPSYNFACVVDDIELGVTSVIRGEDHLSNTPKQIALYHALGRLPPQVAHIPLVLGADRAKLSKRQGAASVLDFREAGILPEALVNYLCLLGWSSPMNPTQEIFTREELIREFTIERLNRTNAVFNEEKLEWVNSQHLKRLAPETLVKLLAPRLRQARWLKGGTNHRWLVDVVRLHQSRIRTLNEFLDQTDYLFARQVEYDKLAVNQHFRKLGVAQILQQFTKRLERSRPFNAQTVERTARDLIAELNVASGDLIHSTRVALTGRAVSPGLFDVMALLGRQRVLQRLRRAVKKIAKLPRAREEAAFNYQ